MKMKLFSKALAGLFIAVSLLAVSCDKDDDNNNMDKTYTVAGTASGTQVVPAVTTSANSTFTGTYNTGTNKLQYAIVWAGLNATASTVSFYGPADIGSNASGAAQFDATITTPGVDGNASGEVTLTEQQETDLLNNKWYYTVSNATYATGELRGQLTTTAQ